MCMTASPKGVVSQVVLHAIGSGHAATNGARRTVRMRGQFERTALL